MTTNLWMEIRSRYEDMRQRLEQRGMTNIPDFPTDDLQHAVNVNQQLRAMLHGDPRPICVTVKQDVWRVPMKEHPADEFTRPYRPKKRRR